MNHITDREAMTALHFAAGVGAEFQVAALLQNGAGQYQNIDGKYPVDKTGSTGSQACRRLLSGDNSAIVKTLLHQTLLDITVLFFA